MIREITGDEAAIFKVVQLQFEGNSARCILRAIYMLLLQAFTRLQIKAPRSKVRNYSQPSSMMDEASSINSST